MRRAQAPAGEARVQSRIMTTVIQTLPIEAIWIYHQHGKFTEWRWLRRSLGNGVLARVMKYGHKFALIKRSSVSLWIMNEFDPNTPLSWHFDLYPHGTANQHWPASSALLCYCVWSHSTLYLHSYPTYIYNGEELFNLKYRSYLQPRGFTFQVFNTGF